jgi:hypothetical protein
MANPNLQLLKDAAKLLEPRKDTSDRALETDCYIHRVRKRLYS